jgi:hypothetical protein
VALNTLPVQVVCTLLGITRVFKPVVLAPPIQVCFHAPVLLVLRIGVLYCTCQRERERERERVRERGRDEREGEGDERDERGCHTNQA